MKDFFFMGYRKVNIECDPISRFFWIVGHSRKRGLRQKIKGKIVAIPRYQKL